MIFIIPIPATTKAITLTKSANTFIPLVNPDNVSIISSLVTISKSFSSPGSTFRIDLITPIASCLVFSYSDSDGASIFRLNDVHLLENFFKKLVIGIAI